MLIDSAQNGSRIALLQDKSLVELHSEGGESQFKVGDIYLGTVRKIVNGLNAAFIDVGYEKAGFLHVYKIDHDDASHISEAELSAYFFCSDQISL